MVGPPLLALFLVATQFAPAAHLSAHRDDHTHGADRMSASAAPHGHDGQSGHEHQPRRREGREPVADHDHGTGRPEHADDHDGMPASDHRSGSQHGQSSAAHFGLALIQAPPAPFLPLPPTTLASPPATILQGRCAGARRQPSARGPPVLLR